MPKQAILERTQNLIAGALDLSAAEITPGQSFRRDLKADSLDSVEIIMSIEEEFGVESTKTPLGALIPWATSSRQSRMR